MRLIQYTAAVLLWAGWLWPAAPALSAQPATPPKTGGSPPPTLTSPGARTTPAAPTVVPSNAPTRPASQPATVPSTNTTPGVALENTNTVSENYLLRANDMVLVRVYQEDDLMTQARLSKDGSITLPMVGEVTIGGQNYLQAAKTIHDKLLGDYLVNPQVTVTILDYARRHFTVLGQVVRPGTYDMPADEKLTLLNALAMAGGPNRYANPKKVTVTRLVNGKTVKETLNTVAMANDANAQSFEVLADDTIFVPEHWL